MQISLDFDAPRGKTATSAAAAERVQLTVKHKREVVLAALKAAGDKGVIAYDCWKTFPDGTLETSIRPRLCELVDKGLAYKTRYTRPNGRGNQETVYRATQVLPHLLGVNIFI